MSCENDREISDGIETDTKDELDGNEVVSINEPKELNVSMRNGSDERIPNERNGGRNDTDNVITSSNSSHCGHSANRNYPSENNSNDDDTRGRHDNVISSTAELADEIIYPSVEWIYPSDNEGSQSNNSQTSRDSITNHSIMNQNDQRIEEGECIEGMLIDYVVDPNDVEVTLTVDGIVVPKRFCLLKICGFAICDDTFPFLLNSKIILLLIGAFVIGGLFAAIFQVENDSLDTNLQIADGVQQSELMNETTLTIDPRVSNITQIIMEVSGSVTLIQNSSQNKALNWILYEDESYLAYNSSNLLQRYAIMVFFFNLSGENWNRNDGYGSGKHECKWYGIACKRMNGSNFIRSLELLNNGLEGQLPKEIAVFSRLDGLRLEGNAISGNIPNSIGELTHLIKLQLGYNRLTGTIPAEITECINVEWIHLQNNQLSGTIPEFSRQQWKLLEISLYYNKLSGTIPTSVGSLNVLGALNLYTNSLKGTLPTELGNANSLAYLDVRDNNLTGEIPASLGNLFSLKALYLSYNMFSGVVPADLYLNSHILRLELNDNLLTGTIPSLSHFLPSITRLYLHSNSINGTIPENIGNSPRLNDLRLHFSKLTGTVPQSLCDRQMVFLTDCAGEDPDVSCSCCSKCY